MLQEGIDLYEANKDKTDLEKLDKYHDCKCYRIPLSQIDYDEFKRLDEANKKAVELLNEYFDENMSKRALH